MPDRDGFGVKCLPGRVEPWRIDCVDVYNPHSDHLAGGLVQQGLSVALNIAPGGCFAGATDKRFSLDSPRERLE